MKKQKLLSLVLVLMMGLSMTANGLAEGFVAEEVSVALGFDISDLAPWSSATNGRNYLLPSIYEYMAYYDSDAESGMVGILMESFEKVDDTTSRVKIFDYIYDSAGNHLTAADVAFSFMSWKENGKSVKCKLLESCVAIDEYTVEIKLVSDTVGDLENMLCGLVPIVTEVAFEASGDGMIENVISTAPYVVEEYVSGSHLTVVKRDDYWQTNDELRLPVSQANARKITWRVVTERSQMAINLETNTVDMTTSLSYGEASRYDEGGTSADDYTVFKIKDANFWWITFNCSEGGMFENNRALRQAISYAIDTEGLVEGVLYGQGEVMKAYGNEVCGDYNDEWNDEPYYEYDTAAAEALISEAGFDKSQTIRIMLPNADTNKAAAQIIQAYLMQIGLNCELLIYDSALFQSYKTDASQWDIMLDSKQSIDYVTSLASTFDANTPAMNFVQDDKLQEMVTSVITVSGHTAEAIDEYMDYLRDECYVYALFVPYTFFVAENTVEDLFINFKGLTVPGASTFSADFVR